MEIFFNVVNECFLSQIFFLFITKWQMLTMCCRTRPPVPLPNRGSGREGAGLAAPKLIMPASFFFNYFFFLLEEPCFQFSLLLSWILNFDKPTSSSLIHSVSRPWIFWGKCTSIRESMLPNCLCHPAILISIHGFPKLYPFPFDQLWSGNVERRVAPFFLKKMP